MGAPTLSGCHNSYESYHFRGFILVPDSLILLERDLLRPSRTCKNREFSMKLSLITASIITYALLALAWIVNSDIA